MLFQEIASPSLWDSSRNLNMLQEQLNRLLSAIPQHSEADFPPLNVWTSETKTVVVAEIPGIDTDNIDLQIVNNVLTLKTKREPDQVSEGQIWHRRERGYGQFSRSLELPYPIDAEKVQASCSNGMLRIELCRAAADQPKKISIQAS